MTTPEGILGPHKYRQLREAGFTVVRGDHVIEGWVHAESLAKYADPGDLRADLRIQNEETAVHGTRVTICATEQVELPL